MFSAVKHQGQPLYKLARRGIEIERQARTVTIHDIRILATTENTFTLHVHCSKGTYIRTLIEDMGAALGFGAYVSGLHRSAVTPYESNSMITLDELELLDNNLTALKPLLLPVNTVVQAMPFIELTKEAVFYIKQGQAVMSPKRNMTGSIQLIDDKGLFMGIGEMLEDGRVAPKRLIEVKAS
jgi:tRNA pseudouridine55 synthase